MKLLNKALLRMSDWSQHYVVPCHTHDRCLRPYWAFSTVTGL